MHASAVAALRNAMSTVGAKQPTRPTDGDADQVVTGPDGSALHLDVRAAAVPTADWVARLRPIAGRQIVVVAEQIPAGIRDELNERSVGWLDRRGHLRLIGDGYFIDADVPADGRTSGSGTSGPAISGRSGLAAAAALLMQSNDPVRVGVVARDAGLNASSISRAMARLAEAQLAERVCRGVYRPLLPELFWDLADVWPGTRIAVQLSLADVEDPRLEAHVDDLDVSGWAVGGDHGAVGWGAPLLLTGDYPALVYVPDEDSIRRAQLIGGTPGAKAHSSRPSVELAVDPVGLLTRTRYKAKNAEVPLAHPVVCALDLAATSRGREALDQWDPPEGFTRVW